MTSALKKILKTGYMMLVIIGLSVVVGLVMAFPVMWLWNWILPEVTGGMIGQLNVWKAWGLNVLVGILFGSKGSK